MTNPAAGPPSLATGGTDADLADRVREIVARACRLDVARVGPADRFREDLGADSLAKLELVVQVERAFEVRFEDEEAAALASVDDVVRRLEAIRAG